MGVCIQLNCSIGLLSTISTTSVLVPSDSESLSGSEEEPVESAKVVYLMKTGNVISLLNDETTDQV